MKFWFSKMLVPCFFCKLWFTHKLSALMELCWHIFMHSLTLPLIPCLATKVHCFSKHFFFQIHFAEDNIQCCWLNIVVRYFKSLVHSQDSPWTFLRVDERQLQKGSLLSVDWKFTMRNSVQLERELHLLNYKRTWGSCVSFMEDMVFYFGF